MNRAGPVNIERITRSVHRDIISQNARETFLHRHTGKQNGETWNTSYLGRE